jgi:hypothetical protein
LKGESNWQEGWIIDVFPNGYFKIHMSYPYKKK